MGLKVSIKGAAGAGGGCSCHRQQQGKAGTGRVLRPRDRHRPLASQRSLFPFVHLLRPCRHDHHDHLFGHGPQWQEQLQVRRRGGGTDSGAVGTVTAVGAEGVRGGAVTPPRLRAWGPGRPRRGLPGAALKGGGETRGSVLGQVGGRGGRRRGPGSTCAVPLRRLPGGSAGGGGRTHPVATGLPVVSASQLRCPGGGGGGWVGGDGDRQAGRPWPFPAAAARRRGVWELQGWELARPTPGCWGVRVRPCLFLTKKGGDSLPRCAATQPHCGAEGRVGGEGGTAPPAPSLLPAALPTPRLLRPSLAPRPGRAAPEAAAVLGGAERAPLSALPGLPTCPLRPGARRSAAVPLRSQLGSPHAAAFDGRTAGTSPWPGWPFC